MTYHLLTVFALLLPLISPIHAGEQLNNKQCSPTTERFIGNNYKPGIAKLSTNTGKGLIMRGRVLSAANCSPVEGAIIERWQAGNNGKYHNRLRAYSISFPDGSYELETEWPDMPTPHIHFIVTADGFNKLVTQWIPDQKTSEAIFDLVLTPSTF